MLEFVKNFLIENNLSDKKILVGYSGGTDSSVLLDILSKLSKNVVAIHLNHNWRGVESKRDEDFAREFAKKRNIEFYCETLNDDVKKTETEAREQRYDFFNRAKEKFNAKAVFLAHNKNDNVETLIYRLIKGTGTKGMNSIPEIRDFYFRPLIHFSREEIEDYAQKNGVEFIVDSSNNNVKYKRNLIRNEILPLMKEINPNVINSISNFIDINIMNQKITDDVILKAEIEIKDNDAIFRDKFLALPVEIQFEIINRKFKGVLKNRDFKNTNKILNFIKENESSKLSLNDELFLKVYDNKIYTLKIKPDISQSKELVLGLNEMNGYKILIEKSDIPDKFLDNTYVKLDFNNRYLLRTRKEGDKVQTFSSNSIQKLKTFLIKKKIPSELRDNIPMIALDDEILFIPDIMTSEKLRVEKSDKTCYKITITKEN